MNNTLLFISHCGLNSVTEAIYFGVPLICIPINWDQYDNAALIKSKGFGLVLDRRHLTEDSIHSAITEVLDNTTFKNNTMHASIRMRSYKRSPLERAIDLIENTARHKDYNPYVPQVPSTLGLIQLHSLDVLAFLTVIFCSLSYLAFFIGKVTYHCVMLHVKAITPLED